MTREVIASFLLTLVLVSVPYIISNEIELKEEAIEPQTMLTDEQEEVQEEKIEEPTLTSLGEYTITAYCGCKKCCGKWASDPVIGAGGVPLYEGTHVASPLPLGTIVTIDGLGTYEVQDRTANWIVEKYNGKIIDIYFESHESALEFGKQTREVFVYAP